MLKKYWAIFEHNFLDAVQYRSEILVWLILDTLPTVVLFFVWKTIFASSPEIKGYTLSSMVEFYFVFLVINNFSGAHFEDFHVMEIREGKIDRFLLQPLSYMKAIFWGYIANKTFYTLILLPSYIVLYFLAVVSFHVNFTSISMWQGAQFVFLLFFACSVEYIFSLLIVLLGFWFEGAEGLQHFKWITITMLGGSLIPTVFLPGWLRVAVQSLPFQYMYAVPIEVIEGFRTLVPLDFLWIFGFIIAMSFFCRFLWSKAQYKYTAAGG